MSYYNFRFSIQERHQLMDVLGEKVEQIKKLSNEQYRDSVTRNFQDINEKWKAFVADLEDQRDNLSKLASEWNVSGPLDVEMPLFYIKSLIFLCVLGF